MQTMLIEAMARMLDVGARMNGWFRRLRFLGVAEALRAIIRPSTRHQRKDRVMNEKVTKFYEAVSADDALQAELVAVTEGVDLEGLSEEEARTAMAEAVAAFAAAHDLDLTVEDVLAADAEAAEGELSEAELEAVAGGASGVGCGCFIIGAVKGCGCFVVGAADSSDKPDGSICVAVGVDEASIAEF